MVDEKAAGRLSLAENFTHKLGFTQIRGSVPVFWAEVNTLRYKPDLQVMELQETVTSLFIVDSFLCSYHSQVDTVMFHLREQVTEYGGQSLINLVNQKGHEQPVKEAYERAVSQVGCCYCPSAPRIDVFQVEIPEVKYQYFDFHNECKHMRWDRISVLIEKMQEDLVQQG